MVTEEERPECPIEIKNCTISERRRYELEFFEATKNQPTTPE